MSVRITVNRACRAAAFWDHVDRDPCAPSELRGLLHAVDEISVASARAAEIAAYCARAPGWIDSRGARALFFHHPAPSPARAPAQGAPWWIRKMTHRI